VWYVSVYCGILQQPVRLISGEWAHLFYVFLLASGLKARYVWNRYVSAGSRADPSEDHVWTEYWSSALKHWVHVDSWCVTSGLLAENC